MKTGRKPTHGGCIGGVLSPIYKRWMGIMGRCHCRSNTRYKDYGGKGIVVCTRWHDFSEFRRWAEESGFEPSLQIDRIDNSKGYSPRNCRWVTCKKNQANRSRSVIFPDGRTTAEVAASLGMSPKSIYNRLKRGMTMDQAMTMPCVPNGFVRKTFNLGLWK
jgi:hypothetical protein